MIVSRAPTRISLAGGGSDLPSFYREHGGYWLSAAVDKYIVVTANRQFHPTYRIKGYTTEEADCVDDVDHNLYREALKMYDVKPGVELVSVSDVPSGSGLGSSGAFLASLLNTLSCWNSGGNGRVGLAEDACRVEIERLGEHVGKQDQYISVYGGITEFTVDRNGMVNVHPLHLSDFVVDDLQRNLYLFYSGGSRDASSILAEQDRKTRENDESVVDTLQWYMEQARHLKTQLEQGNADALGRLMHRYWQRKKRYSDRISSSFIDQCYEMALKCGCLGGKCMGAGGGGFLLFYHNGPSKERWGFVDEMEDLGLRHVPFGFDFEGVKTLYNGGNK